MKKKHNLAIKDYYTKNGVGRTYKQKHAFWNNLHPNTHISHFDLTDDKMRTKAFELMWLCESFPEDFPSC